MEGKRCTFQQLFDKQHLVLNDSERPQVAAEQAPPRPALRRQHQLHLLTRPQEHCLHRLSLVRHQLLRHPLQLITTASRSRTKPATLRRRQQRSMS